MKTTLGEITHIRFGVHAPKLKKGKVHYLVSSHFNEENQPAFLKDSFIELPEDKLDKYLLQPNDVVLTGKGQRLFAWAYHPKYGRIVPSSVFYILRTNPALVNGTYLAAFLNSPKIKHTLELLGKGATITSIAKKDVQDLKMVLPTIEKQNKLEKLLKLTEKEINILSGLLKSKKALHKGIINQFLNTTV